MVWGVGLVFAAEVPRIPWEERGSMNFIAHPVAGRDLGDHVEIPAFAGMSEVFL